MVDEDERVAMGRMHAPKSTARNFKRRKRLGPMCAGA